MGDKLRLVVGRAEALPLEDGSADAVVITHVRNGSRWAAWHGCWHCARPCTLHTALHTSPAESTPA